MKIDFRLNLYNLIEQAMNELLYKVLAGRYKLDDWDIEKKHDSSIFAYPDLNLFFKDYIPNEEESYIFNKEEYYSLITATKDITMDAIVSEKKGVVEKQFADIYFRDSNEYQLANQEILAGEKYNPSNATMFLISLERILSYFPDKGSDRLKLTNVGELVAANQKEKGLIASDNTLRILDIRDYVFGYSYYPVDRYLDGKPFCVYEKAGRQILNQIIVNFYWPRILYYNTQFQSLIKDFSQAIGEKWDILRSKYIRGRYYDEWGVLHEELWNRELQYFIKNIALKTRTIPTFLLNIDLNHSSLISSIHNISIDEHICISFPLKNSLKLWEIENATRSKQHIRDEFAFSLCSIIFEIKLHQEQIFLNKNERPKSITENPLEQNQNTPKNMIDGYDYEFWIKDQLEGFGYSVSVTPMTGDQGIDLIATRDNIRYGIQCKFYSSPVGNSAVQEVIAGKIFYDCDHVCVITNSDFTPSAYQLATKAGVLMCANGNLQILK